ncbi:MULTISPECIES: hypothetical protein [Bacillus]|uniref:Uncharacterized protein n=1 Tax=Bacillus infantis NRRL B-14911 TaxID=1367477 RepID=U5L4G7_9BACI|nr:MULTISPECIES: hypothetical protein [Bacillus]AGX02494.1 hypothetical protein N288_02650 [Bacillus infantis NRRL B-14911]EAR67392.1 hypothetical protein B14911_18395 [Bacillus sp. NRRL B-14911]MCA1037352.1 hypothetical protein [Bacillus infantis]
MLKKKKLVIGIGILAALAIMLLMDAVKISNEKRPPNPVVMVDGEKVDADLRGYTWHGETQAVKRANAASVTEVKPRSEITVQFGTKDEPESIALDTIYGTDRKKPVYTGTYTLSNKPGPITMRIKAKWEGKGQAEYTVSLDVEEESSYQELLAEEAGEYTVLAIRENDQSDLGVTEDVYQAGANRVEYRNLDTVQRIYTDLEVRQAPYFIVFSFEKPVLGTSDPGEAAEYIRTHAD